MLEAAIGGVGAVVAFTERHLDVIVPFIAAIGLAIWVGRRMQPGAPWGPWGY